MSTQRNNTYPYQQPQYQPQFPQICPYPQQQPPYPLHPPINPSSDNIYPPNIRFPSNRPIPPQNVPYGLYPPMSFRPPLNRPPAIGFQNLQISDISWIRSFSGMSCPPTAIRGGTDQDGTAIYVGRAHFGGDIIPAKVIPEKQIAYVCYNGKEEMVHEFEVLCQGSLNWEYATGGSVPDGALPVGSTSEGETLYAGRVWHEGSHTVGKVHCSHGHCYIPFNGEEVPYSEYEVLVLK